MYELWERIQDIMKQAKRCRLRRDYKAGCNSAVHRRFLNLACQLSGYNDYVWAVNISDPQYRQSVKTWNHTKGQLIAELPLAFGIETKQQADKDDKAQLQFGTWVSAHEAANIFLSRIKVQGAHLTFMLVRGDYDGANGSLKVVLDTGKMMGYVTGYGGFFRLLACVRRIVV
ncbi:hypothetical protein M433DRAFT_173803 [Acidomyces richmondensis BFW]|nr:hypothetical protein M433DRAFT_173803 [Acidomyces richmondensis BFW]